MQNTFLKLQPSYRDYVWGGDRLRPGHSPTAEAWIVWEGDVITDGQFAGQTLVEVAEKLGADLLGKKTVSKTGNRFPLLIKLLDCAQWLSLQVHPTDELALQIEGPGQFGKTEAWHVLDAQPGAKLIAGLKPNISSNLLAESIRDGSVIDHVQYANVKQGDTVFMPAGTLHALGPGLLIYEVQQTSDWTYRVYDWGRPQTEARKLHIEKSIQVTKADSTAPVIPPPQTGNGTKNVLVSCEYFTLELLSSTGVNMELDTKEESFHALTVIEGQVTVQANEESTMLGKYQTLVVPASLGSYQITTDSSFKILKSSV